MPALALNHLGVSCFIFEYITFSYVGLFKNPVREGETDLDIADT